MKCFNGIESELCSCYVCKMKYAPTPEDRAVAFITKWQNSSFVHPLTCGDDSNHEPLIPFVEDNLVLLSCPTCGYQQFAPDFFFDITFDQLIEMIRNPYANLFKQKDDDNDVEPSD